MLLIDFSYSFHLIMSLSLCLSPCIDEFESGTVVPEDVSVDDFDEVCLERVFEAAIEIIVLYISLIFPVQICFAYVHFLMGGEYHDNFSFLLFLFFVSMALCKTKDDMKPKVSAPVSSTETEKHETPVSSSETEKHETVHTETKTDAAGNSSTTTTTTVSTTNTAKSLIAAAPSLTLPTATPMAIGSSNKLATNCTIQNNGYTSLLADEDVLEVVGSDDNL